MRKNMDEIMIGQLLDEDVVFHIKELCDLSHAPTQLVIEMVEYGLLEPQGIRREEWRFTGPAVGRVKTVMRLQHDLDVNLPGAAVIIELLEELEQLRRAIR